MRESLRWALRAGRRVVPVLEVVWKSRGQTIETHRFAPSGHDWPTTFALPIVSARGGFGGIREGPSILPGSVEPVKCKVTIDDPDMEWSSWLERYNPKYSEATIYLACPDLVPSDWEPLFVGLVDGWTINGPKIDFALGSDDRALYAECPKATFEKSVWSYAPDPVIFGTSIPYVFGIQDAYQITARGMIVATCVMWDETRGYKWLASGGMLKAVRRIFYDGIVQTFTPTIERGTYGSVEATLISIPKASLPGGAAEPDKNTIVAFDCEGPDTTGRHTGTVLTNPVDELRIQLINYVFGNLRYGSYAQTHPRIHKDSWDSVAAIFTQREHESGRVLGGNREKLTGVGLIESFLTPNTMVRMWWDAQGQIRMCAIGLPDAAATDEYSNLSLLDPATVKHSVVASDVFTDVEMSYIYSNAEQAYLASYLAQDIGLSESLRQINVLLLENPWTQTRFTDE